MSQFLSFFELNGNANSEGIEFCMLHEANFGQFSSCEDRKSQSKNYRHLRSYLSRKTSVGFVTSCIAAEEDRMKITMKQTERDPKTIAMGLGMTRPHCTMRLGMSQSRVTFKFWLNAFCESRSGLLQVFLSLLPALQILNGTACLLPCSTDILA